MRKAVLILAVAVLGCEPADRAPEAEAFDAAAEERALREQVTRWNAAVPAGDTAFIRALHASDAVVMPANGPAARGGDAIVEMWSGLMNTPGMRLDIQPSSFDFSSGGDMAYELGTYTLQVPVEGGEPMRDTGKYLVLWEKRDGAWKVVADIWNSDIPLQTPGA